MAPGAHPSEPRSSGTKASSPTARSTGAPRRSRTTSSARSSPAAGSASTARIGSSGSRRTSQRTRPASRSYRSTTAIARREVGHILGEADLALVVRDETAHDDAEVQELLAGVATLDVGDAYERVAVGSATRRRATPLERGRRSSTRQGRPRCPKGSCTRARRRSHPSGCCSWPSATTPPTASCSSRRSRIEPRSRFCSARSSWGLRRTCSASTARPGSQRRSRSPGHLAPGVPTALSDLLGLVARRWSSR